MTGAAPSLPARIRRRSGGIVSRLLGLPPPTTGYHVHRGIRVRMRDGIDLIADHYAPATDQPAGTLLVRGPYGRGWPFSTLYSGFYAARGYHVLMQSVRGTFGSGDDFTPMLHEVADGIDTAAWLREQPWYTGSFATIGLSYLGFVQWALLTDPPDDMKAAVITVGPHDLAESSWGTGAFTLYDFLGWSHLVAHQEDPGRLRAIVRQLRSRRVVARAADRIPIGETGRALLGTRAPWYEGWLGHSDTADEFWESMRLIRALECADVPVLLIGGWQDLFIGQTMTQFRNLADRGANVAMTIGSWTHTHFVTRAAPIVLRETLEWLDTHLAHPGTRAQADTRSPVRIHVHNADWIDLPDWPPAAEPRTMYLQPGGRLADSWPEPAGPASLFTYDPTCPTPTIGGRLLSPEGGYRTDTRLAERADVLSFTGDPLPHDLFLLGTPVVELAHSCDNPHHDLFVRISEVDANGRSINVTDGYRRLAGPEPAGSRPIRIELDPVAHRFAAGTRIRLLVAGGSHPRFARNLGTGESQIAGRRTATATHTVHHGDGGLSRVVLPVSPYLPGADRALHASGDVP